MLAFIGAVLIAAGQVIEIILKKQKEVKKMIASAIAAAAAAKWLMAAKIAIALGPVFMAAQRVADSRERVRGGERR